MHAPLPATWRRSSHSTGTGNNCVEVAALPQGIGVRDSKNIDAGALVLPRQAWRDLAKQVKAGSLDL